MRFLYLILLLPVLLFATESDYELSVVQKNEKQIQNHHQLSVVESDDMINTNSGFVIDYYKEISGIFTQQTAPGQGSPFIRGLTGPHTLILFDGIRLNSAIFRYGPNQYAAMMDPNIIGKIEVIKGSAPVLYGSDAIGGVVSLKSFNIDFKGRTRIGYDSSNSATTLHGGAGIQRNWGEAGLMFSMNQTDHLSGGDGVGVQPFTSFENYSATGKVVLTPKIGRITLFGSYFTQLDGYRTDKSSSSKYRIYPEQNHLLTYINYKQYLDCFHTAIDATFSYQYTLERLEEFQRNNIGTFDQKKDYKDQVHQYQLALRAITYLKQENIQLFYGLEGSRDYVLSNKQYLDEALYDTFGQYLRGEYRLGDFLFGLGERYTFVWLHENSGIEYLKNSVSFSGFAQYFVNKYYNISLNLAQGFRAPNLNDLTGNIPFNYGFEFGSDDLVAEKGYMVELNQNFSMGGIQISGAIYAIFLRDFIGRQPIDAPEGYEAYDQVVQKSNSGSGTLYGGEIQAQYTHKSYLTFKGSLTYTYGEMDEESYQDGVLVVEENPMRRIPPLNGQFQINYRFNKQIETYYQFKFAMKQDRLSNGDISDSRIPEGGTPGFDIHNIGMTLTFNLLSLHLKFSNLLDQKYKYHGSSAYSPGRSFRLAINYQF